MGPIRGEGVGLPLIVDESNGDGWLSRIDWNIKTRVDRLLLPVGHVIVVEVFATLRS